MTDKIGSEGIWLDYWYAARRFAHDWWHSARFYTQRTPKEGEHFYRLPWWGSVLGVCIAGPAGAFGQAWGQLGSSRGWRGRIFWPCERALLVENRVGLWLDTRAERMIWLRSSGLPNEIGLHVSRASLTYEGRRIVNRPHAFLETGDRV